MSKGKEEGKEKEKIMETSTIPSSEVFTFVKKQLEDIGFELSFDELHNNYSVSTSMHFFNLEDLSELIKVLKRPYANFVTELDFTSRYIKGNIKNFVEQLKDTNITTLNLTNNAIRNAGATALADVIKQGGSKITVLHLNNNDIGDAGATALADAIKQGGSKITVLHLNNNRIRDEGTKALDGLKDIIGKVVYDYKMPSTTITSSTTSTTTTSLSTTSSSEQSSSSSSSSNSSESYTAEISPQLLQFLFGKTESIKKKEEGKEKEKMKDVIMASPLNGSVSKPLDRIYVKLIVEAEKLFTLDQGDKYPALDEILQLITKDPQGAYKKLIVDKGLDDGIFIKLLVREELPSHLMEFTFNNKKYLMDLVKKGNFDLKDPMLLAYAVGFKNQDIALSVTKELVKKGAVIADNILFHSYNNPYVTKFLLIEKPSIITCQDEIMGTDAVKRKVKYNLNYEPDNVKFKATLDMLKAAETGGEDLSTKLDIICPPSFSQDVSSTTQTTTTSVSTTSSLEKSSSSSSSSSTSSPSSSSSFSSDDSVSTSSLITLSLSTTEDSSTELIKTLTLAGDVSSYESAS